ncbi:p53 apoptosis effector related to PMP-22-like [Amphiura filiformis]|uniref:p53 apoptosis effector related to PMP-22-like n=1 Tax=Amphiura filiformis TaxID=82378 RepID=UPI003B20F47C
MEEDRTETTVTTRVIRPFKIIAIILAIIGAILLIVAIASSVWIRAVGFYQGLWQECFNGTRVLTTPSPGVPLPTGEPITCYKAMSSGWLHTCQAFEVVALILTIIGIICAIVAQVKGKSYSHFYKIGGILLIIAALCQVIALAVFPAKAIQEDIVLYRTNWELGWGYGMGWGVFLLQVVAGILLIFAPDKQEIYYSEKTYYQ